MPADLGCRGPSPKKRPERVTQESREGEQADLVARSRRSAGSASPRIPALPVQGLGGGARQFLQNQGAGPCRRSGLPSCLPWPSRVCRWGQVTPRQRERREVHVLWYQEGPAWARAAEGYLFLRFSPPAAVGSVTLLQGTQNWLWGWPPGSRTTAIWVSRDFL